jgi:hypothetical protein
MISTSTQSTSNSDPGWEMKILGLDGFEWTARLKVPRGVRATDDCSYCEQDDTESESARVISLAYARQVRSHFRRLSFGFCDLARRMADSFLLVYAHDLASSTCSGARLRVESSFKNRKLPRRQQLLYPEMHRRLYQVHCEP